MAGEFQEKKLYHQIHPLKLAVDIGVTPVALYLCWAHRLLPAALVAFGPPLVVSLAMMKWTPELEKLKRSGFGRYIKRYMTPLIEVIRLLTLVPMAYGAWNHDLRFIALGFAILAIACPRRSEEMRYALLVGVRLCPSAPNGGPRPC